jgi:hypothetical protein
MRRAELGAHLKSDLKVDRALRHVAWQVAPWRPTGRTVFQELRRSRLIFMGITGGTDDFRTPIE